MPRLFQVKPTRQEDAQRCPERSEESEALETRHRGDSECGGRLGEASHPFRLPS